MLFVDRVKSVKFESKREPVAVGEDSPLEAAKKAAEAWLLLWDAGRHDEVHERASKQSDYTRRNWYVLWYALRRSLGDVKVRKFIQAMECREEKQNWIGIVFETSFEHRDQVNESLIVRLDGDQRWRVAAYLNNTSRY